MVEFAGRALRNGKIIARHRNRIVVLVTKSGKGVKNRGQIGTLGNMWFGHMILETITSIADDGPAGKALARARPLKS